MRTFTHVAALAVLSASLAFAVATPVRAADPAQPPATATTAAPPASATMPPMDPQLREQCLQIRKECRERLQTATCPRRGPGHSPDMQAAPVDPKVKETCQQIRKECHERVVTTGCPHRTWNKQRPMMGPHEGMGRPFQAPAESGPKN